jgi:hypothetical protein
MPFVKEFVFKPWYNRDKENQFKETIMEKYDIAVVGGGFAGACAAISAARSGAKVILIDKSGSLGGAATNCLVNPFMPYWTTVDGERVNLSAGLFREIRSRLNEIGSMVKELFLEEDLKLILNDMTEEAGVDLLYHAYLSKVDKREGRVSSVTVATKQGEIELFANTFIDATGDAQLAFLAGCPTMLGREPDHLCQPMTLCFRVGNVDVEKFYEGKNALMAEHAKSLAAGELTNPRENILVFRYPIGNVLHFNTTRVVKLDPTNAEDVTKAEIIAREQVFEMYNFLRENFEEFKDSTLISTGMQIGVRESRMIEGEYTLTKENLLSCARFEDSIAVCNYDIDIHSPDGSGTSHYYFPKGEYYTIPYRCLIPKNAENLLVSGRCVSADHDAQASLRIMPTCATLGEAAGIAASLALDKGSDVRLVDVELLRSILRKNGAKVD